MAFKIIDLLVIEEYLLAIEIFEDDRFWRVLWRLHNKTILQA